jgi:hypothetical protein
VPLEKIARGKEILVDTPDTAPPADAAEQGLTEKIPRTAAPVAPDGKPLQKISVPVSANGTSASTPH